jgi:8-amino-7-oxononanoate synthase
MVDFTSALYLGFTHVEPASNQAEPLTLGKPSVLEEPPGSLTLATQTADLVGCEAGLTAPSTLHLALDVAAFLAEQDVEFFADRGVYPISRWGLELASARGRKVQWFRHHNSESLREALRSGRRRPVVVADGYCPACGAHAPLGDYLALVRERGGLLLLDDTQALGIFGHRGGPSPYGSGGGGSLRFLEAAGRDIVMMSSLSKAFGAPVACLLGSSTLIQNFAERSRTRMHCSPPSTAVIRAGLHALKMNRESGDLLRRRLFQLVKALRSLLLRLNWSVARSSFPVQAVDHPDAPAIQRRLLSLGVRALLQKAGDGRGTRVTFVLNATHKWDELGEVARALDATVKGEKTHEWANSI